MGFAYTIKEQGAVHFVTFTVHQWVDVFTRKEYVDLLLESLKYCQVNKGLEVFGWVIMSNHCHLIIRARNENLSDVIRDLKKFTAKAIYKAIESNPKESRRGWLLRVLSHNGKIWLWEEGYHGEEITSQNFFDTKLRYLHQNPVKAGIVEKEEEYLHSSCRDYYGIREEGIPLVHFG
jgi:putative transposase